MFKLTDYYSFYVFVWFILYKINIIPYNPIVIFYFILTFVLWMLSYMIYLKISIKKIIIFIIAVILFTKVLPILLLKHEYKPNDILFGVYMFFIYHIILYYTKNIEPIQFYINFIKDYKKISDDDILKKFIFDNIKF